MVVIVGCLFFFDPKTNDSQNLGLNSQFMYDTTSKGFTATTSTINTTATQLFSSVGKVNYIFIPSSTAVITCSLDPANTTAASSSVASGRGVLVMGSATAVTRLGFGQCFSGNNECYLHTGAVNCLSSASVTISKVIQ